MRRRDVRVWLCLDEAAELGKVSRRAIYRWIRSGRVESRNGRTGIEIRRADIVTENLETTLLDLFEPMKDDELARLLLGICRERRAERSRSSPRFR